MPRSRRHVRGKYSPLTKGAARSDSGRAATAVEQRRRRAATAGCPFGFPKPIRTTPEGFATA